MHYLPAFHNNTLLRLPVLIVLLLLSSCSVPQRFYAVADNREVHHFEMVNIGGVEQALLINGKSADNPVLLYLHGGPGFPMLPFKPFSQSMRDLENYFTIVYWEQRGTGRSFSRKLTAESMTIEQFIADTREIVEYLKEKLGVKKVFLWGHSWGSNLGAIYASRYPETLYAYLSTGQSVNPFLNERLAYEFVKERAIEENNRRALRQLARIDTVPANYTIDDALTVRRWVYRYGGIVYDNAESRPYVDFGEMQTILSSPVYPWIVRLNLILNPYFSIEKLWTDLKELNLFEKAPKIEVPVYFLVGRHDIIVSHVLAEKYFEQLKAPEGKELIWFERSAHRPFAEENKKFLQVMQEIHTRHHQQEVSARQ